MDIFIYEMEIVNVYKGNIGQGLVRLVSKQLFWLGTSVDSTAVLIPAPSSFLESTEKKVWKTGLERGKGKKKTTP